MGTFTFEVPTRDVARILTGCHGGVSVTACVDDSVVTLSVVST